MTDKYTVETYSKMQSSILFVIIFPLRYSVLSLQQEYIHASPTWTVVRAQVSHTLSKRTRTSRTSSIRHRVTLPSGSGTVTSVTPHTFYNYRISIAVTKRRTASHISSTEQVGAALMHRIYFYSGDVPVRISAGTPAILNKVFRGIPQSLKENTWIVR